MAGFRGKFGYVYIKSLDPGPRSEGTLVVQIPIVSPPPTRLVRFHPAFTYGTYEIIRNLSGHSLADFEGGWAYYGEKKERKKRKEERAT